MKVTASPTVFRFFTSSSGIRTPELLLGVHHDGHHRERVDVQVVGEGLVSLHRVGGQPGLSFTDLGESAEDVLLAQCMGVAPSCVVGVVPARSRSGFSSPGLVGRPGAWNRFLSSGQGRTTTWAA
jgi:hypothetical protein